MTTLLTQTQTDALRSIGDSALVLFAMAMIDGNYPGRATKPEELLPYLHPTYKDRRKLTTQLEALSASGRLAKQGAGYVLLEGGRALVLSMSSGSTEPTNALAQSPALAAGTQAQALVLDVDSVDFEAEHPARALRALKKEEEESLILEEKESSSSDSAQNARTDAVEIAPGVTTERILLASSSLEDFGEGVFLQGLDVAAIHPRMALGWLAQAYTERSRLGSPAGLVYSRLRNPDMPKPRAKYYEGWESFLPAEFLRSIGWRAFCCPDCEETFESAEDLHTHERMMMSCEYNCGARFHTMDALTAHHEAHGPKIQQYTVLPSDHRGAKAWQMVRETLRAEMPKASFETWVRDAEAVCLEGNTLSLVVRNGYVADWLSSRLAAQIETLLKKYTTESMVVSFVVGKIEEEEA